MSIGSLPEQSHDVKTSVDKALGLLDVFAVGDRDVGVSELARRAGMPKSTAFRLLTILESNHFVKRQGQRYALGHHLFELGQRVPYCQHGSLRDIAVPFLEDLCRGSSETVHLAVLDGVEAIYINKIHGHARSHLASSIGSRVPVNCSGVGKALLAHSDQATIAEALQRGLRRRTAYSTISPRLMADELQRIREHGVAFDNEEAMVGINCVGAPILDASGQAIASISVAGPVGRFKPQRFASAVRRTAAAIARAAAERDGLC
jgi:DNA-binding IclR family transcriptional regulator